MTARADHELMQRYCQGDDAAFATLYDRHEISLYRFVRRLLGMHFESQVEEVFQDCWLNIISARDSFRSDTSASWKTWAFTIAHNLAMDRLRRSSRQIAIDDVANKNSDANADSNFNSSTDDALDWLQTEWVSASDVDDIAHWRGAGKQLLQCLDGLSSEQRAAFLLHHEDGLSLEGIAQKTAQGFETVKSRLRYALNKLRDCMKHYLDTKDERSTRS